VKQAGRRGTGRDRLSDPNPTRQIRSILVINPQSLSVVISEIHDPLAPSRPHDLILRPGLDRVKGVKQPDLYRPLPNQWCRLEDPTGIFSN
jgi:hypothetical protein